MIGRTIFLCSMLKGLDAYPRPMFWALLYLGYLTGAEYLFMMAVGQWKGPLVYGLLGFSVAYGVFRGLRELQDGLPYWALFCVGFFLLIAVLP